MAGVLAGVAAQDEGEEYNNLVARLLNGLGTAQTQLDRIIEIEAGWDGDDVVAVDIQRTQFKTILASLSDLADPLT